MTELIFSSDITVKLIDSMGHDDRVIQSAQVSAKGENNPDTVPPRLINALLKQKHGSTFEHSYFTFYVKAPIFVFREWMRHRMSSFNEMSGRYTELPGEFYVPAEDRKLFNQGTKMKPDFVTAPQDVVNEVKESVEYISHAGWNEYQRLLKLGVATEVSRIVLPVNIYSQMYWTVNARSLMNFLSLRGSQEGAALISHPQREIQMGAEKIDKFFAEDMPLTHEAFVNNGRVAP
jgi:thymidylate synthase (FAD)